MRKNKLNKVLVLVLASLLLTAAPSYATLKLEFTGPIADILNKIEKVKEKVEDVQSKILKEKEKWTKKAEDFMGDTLGTEGSALFKEYVVKSGAGIVKSVAKGQFNAGDFGLSGFTDSLKSELGNYKLDYATLMAQSRDAIEAAEKAKREKNFAMEVQIAKLEAEWEAKNKLNATLKSEELRADMESIAQRIKDLKKEKEELSNKMEEKSAELQKMQAEMSALQSQMDEYSGKISHDELLKKLNAEALNLFDEMEEEETASLYASSIEKLFLGEYEVGMSENRSRILKARKEEYFKSMKNLVYVIVNTYKSIGETQDKMKKCEQARDEAQATFGQEAMRVCVDLQVAKVAAQYMEMLIGQMRFEASAEIQSWVDMYKLPDYDRDYTKFNLDDYVVTENDFKKNIKQQIYDKVNNGISNFKGF